MTINKNEWELVGNPNELNSYYRAVKPINALSKFIFDNGSMLAYIETVKGIKSGLPFVSHRGGEDNMGEYLWTQTYDIEFEIGKVTFYITYSDFSTKIRPDTETYHIVLMW